MRYKGHRIKHARRHDHGHPGTPQTRQAVSVPGAMAPMPAETEGPVRHMKRGLPFRIPDLPTREQSLLSLAYPHSRPGVLELGALGHQGFWDTQDAGLGPSGQHRHSRKNATPHLTTGAEHGQLARLGL